MSKPATPIRFIEFDNGCMVCVSHKMNKDGYFRKMWKNSEGWLRLMMHRVVWEYKNGSIPEGYEIDHKCRNPGCCNPEHLQVLSVSDHKAKTNKEWSKDCKEKGIKYRNR